jgi:hypothetical protein
MNPYRTFAYVGAIGIGVLILMTAVPSPARCVRPVCSMVMLSLYPTFVRSLVEFRDDMGGW